jgi:type I restriction enzyme M protein
MTDVVQKLWGFCHTLRHDGIDYGDYIEQITYLLFLKMASEQSTPGMSIPSRYAWDALKGIDDDTARLARYHQGLRKLSLEKGLIGLIFTKPQSKINDPAKLHLLIQMIDSEQWSNLDLDVKGEVYEGLLARNADDVRGGAGQYFTPRPVVRAIVEVMRPEPSMRISDPACGTGGFLLAAFEYLKTRTRSAKESKFLRNRALHGVDLVPNVARLCAMNLFLSGVGGELDHPVVTIGDSLEMVPEKVDMVLTNPPFGKKSSFTILGEDRKQLSDRFSYRRPDFWATTSNKQLNFVQHVYAMLRESGRAAVVVPDNVLFEGGAGERIRRQLLERCDVHTLLRLPTGIWYSAGVKANVLFFEKKSRAASPSTKAVWVYDLRSDQKFSLRQSPIGPEHLTDFVKSYQADDLTKRRETERFRRFGYDQIMARDKANLDLHWRDSSSVSSEEESPNALMKGILTDLEEAMKAFSKVGDRTASHVRSRRR